MSTAAATAGAPAAPAAPLTFRDVLRIDVMRNVWLAQVISLFGDFLALFAVIAVVSFRMNGTAAQLTGLQIAYMLPIVFVGPIAGVFVDRWPLKPTLISSDLMRAVIALLLIPSTAVWHVYVVLAALSCVSAFFGPAQQVTIRSHVPVVGVISADALRQLARRFVDTTLVLWGLAGIGAGVLLLGAVPYFAAALAATFTVGFAFGAVMVPAQTLIQRETPHDMLGRVGSTNASVIFLGQVLGLAVSGVLAQFLGVRLVFFLCAALSVVLAAGGYLFLRRARPS